MDIKIDYEINRDDYAKFNLHHFKKTRLKRTIISGSISLIILQVFLNRDEFHPIPTVLSIFMIIGFYWIVIWRSINRAKNTPSEDGAFIGSKELIFSDRDIVHSDKSSNGTINWSAIKSIQKGKSAYYLYLDTAMAIIIPLRYFKSDSDMTDFEKFVESKIGNTE